jgi:asparagine synthase (glutamine-hydrolysing)
MCGIAGLVRFEGLDPDERELGATMAATLRHRGPDDTGGFHDHWASLGHARLSIIDLDNGRQPMSNEDGRIWVTFNGEIYNHHELAADLRARGHQLRTRCDTEVLVHLYEDHGPDFVHRLNGMFAIALWDAGRRTLLLVRDRLGVKPLYWHDDGRRVVFGSELKALLVAGVDRRVDLCALTDYLTFGHVPAPRTIFRDMRKLEPGCMAIFTAAGARVRTWWDIPPTQGSGRRAGLHETGDCPAFGAFGDTIEDAAALRLEADVPVGAFLSGGVDSATVVAAMRRRATSPVLTQTVGFDEADHDERAAARATADCLATDHREIMVRADSARAAELLAWHFDEPFADSSAVPTYYLSKATRERVTVALAGDGADEMLGGYRRYRFDLAESRIRARVPAWLRCATVGVAGQAYPKADWLPRSLRAKVTLQNLATDDATAHLRSVSLRAGALPGLLLRSEIGDALIGYDPYARGRSLFESYSSPDILGRLLYLDMKTLLPDDMLTKVDRASMAVGLEVREPLLDYRVIEQAVQMPSEDRLDKRALRRVLAGWAGPQIAARPKKGFDVPVDAWFRGPLREMAHDLLTSPQASVNEWLEPRAVRGLLGEHNRGLRSNGSVLWTIMMLELWARAFVK